MRDEFAKAMNQAKRKLEKTFHKKSLNEKVMELKVQFSLLSQELEARISMDGRKARQLAEQNVRNPRVEARIKNAYYTRLVIAQARVDLEDVVDDGKLNAVVNRTSRAVAKLNAMAEFSPKIGEKFFRWQSEALNQRVKPDEGYKKELEPKLDVPDDILKRLLDGSTVQECLTRDRLIVENGSLDTEDALDDMANVPMDDLNDQDAEEARRLIREMQKTL